MQKILTAESVASGHPDKICDQVSDAIVDACLQTDAFSRVAVDTLVTHNQVVLCGEVSSQAQVDYVAIAREVIEELGYTHTDWGFSHLSKIDCYIHQQAQDIAQGVTAGGAGDQGVMVGYACQETPELMPINIAIAHQLMKNLDLAREKQTLAYLRPDGKAEVVVNYEDDRAVDVQTVILACPHEQDITQDQLKADLWREVIEPALNKYLPNRRTEQPAVIINGTGKWEIGGPNSDSGLTGRKIVIDHYGPDVPVGGGAFSGKDASKVDRSGAYAMRYVAKNIVAQGLAKRCQTKVAYVIGQAKPVSFEIDTFGSEQQSLMAIKDFANKLLDLSVQNIIEQLELRLAIYRQTACYGHFGREGFSWEKVSP